MAKNKNAQIFFNFANLTCKISGPKKNIDYISKSYKKSPFAGYISKKSPKGKNLLSTLTLEVRVAPQKKRDIFKLTSRPEKLEFELTCTQNTFFVFPVIEQVLRKIFYIMFFKDDGLILHASGIIRKDKAYVFTGPTGAGKSTSAKMLNSTGNFEIFADNNLYVKKEKNRFVIYKSPFLEWNVHYKEELDPKEHYHIDSIFVLDKAKENVKKKLSFPEAVDSIAQQIQIPLTSLAKKEIQESRKLIFDLIQKNITEDKIYLLSFNKDTPEKLAELIR